MNSLAYWEILVVTNVKSLKALCYMFFTSSFNDTDFVSLRRSIYTFASFTAVLGYYGVTLNIGEISNAVISSEREVVLTHGVLLAVLGIFQAYLLIRLWFAKSIELAKLQKIWNDDQINENGELKNQWRTLKNDLDRISGTGFPGTSVDGDISKQWEFTAESLQKSEREISKLCQDLASPLNTLAAFAEYQKNNTEKIEALVDILSQTTPAEFKAILSTLNIDNAVPASFGYVSAVDTKEKIERIKERFEVDHFTGPAIKDSIEAAKSLPTTISSIAEEITQQSHAVSEVMTVNKQKVDFCKMQALTFDDAAFGKVIAGLSEDLAEASRQRRKEFKIFELCIPTFVGIASIAFAAYCIFPDNWANHLKTVTSELISVATKQFAN